MYATDFEYDGQFLSDFGFIICKFNPQNGVTTVNVGSNITFNKVPHNHGRSFCLVSTQYDKCISTTLDICKNPDFYDREHMEITNDECRSLVKWLNRKEFLKFQILNDDGREPCYYNASFNIEKIYIADALCGLRLKMETDSPFGYGDMVTVCHNFSDITKPFTFLVLSDEYGIVYPMVVITCQKDGNITLYNEHEDCTTVIKNCKVDEIITLDCKNQMIFSNYDSHDVANDFNYEFFRIGCSYDKPLNIIYSSTQCDIKIMYNPIIKDSP